MSLAAEYSEGYLRKIPVERRGKCPSPLRKISVDRKGKYPKRFSGERHLPLLSTVIFRK